MSAFERLRRGDPGRERQPARAGPVARARDCLSKPARPLERGIRAAMESSFGHDFSRVRVHADAEAAEAVQAVGAIAYTVGRDIVFGRDRYAPHDELGRRLIAHELSHVVQQHGAAGDVDRLQVSAPGDGSEREAEEAATAVAGGRRPHQPAALSHQVIQRQPQVPVTLPLTWDAKENISAGVADHGVLCIGSASANGNKYLQTTRTAALRTQSLYPYGQNCAPVCTKRPLSLHFFFWVDGDLVPRPQPFDDPRIALDISFAPASAPPMAAARPVFSATSVGKYVGPGAPLKTSFGTEVAFVPPEPGTLYVSEIIDDPTSGEVAQYGDAIPVVDCPVPAGTRTPPKAQLGELRTGTIIVVPDPVKSPLIYYRATGHEQVDPPGFYADLMRDSTGYFYYNTGFKYYIDYPP